jgi:hypothetical protein
MIPVVVDTHVFVAGLRSGGGASRAVDGIYGFFGPSSVEPIAERYGVSRTTLYKRVGAVQPLK